MYKYICIDTCPATHDNDHGLMATHAPRNSEFHLRSSRSFDTRNSLLRLLRKKPKSCCLPRHRMHL